MKSDLSARTVPRLVSGDRVKGTAVRGLGGEGLGTIDKVFSDKLSGQAELAILAFGGVLGIGAKPRPCRGS